MITAKEERGRLVNRDLSGELLNHSGLIVRKASALIRAGMLPVRFIANWIALLGLAFLSPVALAVNHDLTLPAELAGHVRVNPGAVGSFTFDIRNRDNQAGTAIGWGHILDDESAYTFGPGQPAQCGTPYASYLSFGLFRWSFPVVLDAGASMRCTYPVMRSAASRRDSQFFLCTGPNGIDPLQCAGPGTQLILGTLPDMAVATSPVAQLPAGSIEALVTVTVRNLSNVGVDSIRLATECRGSSFPAARPYTLHGNFEGACPSVQFNPGCEYDGGFGVPPPIENWIVDMPATAAAGSSSCLVKMRFAGPLSAPVLDSIEWRRPLTILYPEIPLTFAPNARGRDVNAANDGLTPFGASPIFATPVPLNGYMAWITLVVLLMAVAARRIRNRSLKI